MASRYAGGRGGGRDDGGVVLIGDEYGSIIDMSAPRVAGEPRPGPWHQIMFEAFGGPFRCQDPTLGCAAGAECDNQKRDGLMDMAADKGYQGPPDARQIRQFLRPFFGELVEGAIRGAGELDARVILPGGGPPVGGRTYGRHGGSGGGGGGRHGQGHGSPSGRRLGGGGGGHGLGRHGGGGHRSSMSDY
ncbi:MAG: hypothetical protein Q9168_005102 [Polycauliona sp. 1 TL-2023]